MAARKYLWQSSNYNEPILIQCFKYLPILLSIDEPMLKIKTAKIANYFRCTKAPPLCLNDYLINSASLFKHMMLMPGDLSELSALPDLCDALGQRVCSHKKELTHRLDHELS